MSFQLIVVLSLAWVVVVGGVYLYWDNIAVFFSGWEKKLEKNFRDDKIVIHVVFGERSDLKQFYEQYGDNLVIPADKVLEASRIEKMELKSENSEKTSEKSGDKYNVEYQKDDDMKNSDKHGRKEKNKQVFEEEEPELNLDHSQQGFDEDVNSGIDRDEGNNDSGVEDVPEEEIRNEKVGSDEEEDDESGKVDLNHEDISQFDDGGDVDRDGNNDSVEEGEGDIPDGEVEESREEDSSDENNTEWYSSEEDIIY
jgi:hypothetical protein